MADDVDDDSFESVEDIEQLFEEATDYVKSLHGLKDEEKLLFYGLFKQAKVGPCNIPKPSFWDFVGKAKWESWNILKDLDKETAMIHYIRKLSSIDPDWEIKNVACDKNAISASSQQTKDKQSMGLSVSTLGSGCPNDNISDAEKTIFDWCKDGNVEKIDLMLSTGQDINHKDNQGMALIHWACDRGHNHVVDYLIKNKADINTIDNEGQTPLHYAATCEFIPIVRQLLDANADPSIADTDGCIPSSATDNKEIKKMLTS